MFLCGPSPGGSWFVDSVSWKAVYSGLNAGVEVECEERVKRS